MVDAAGTNCTRGGELPADDLQLPEIKQGTFHAYFIFDITDTIDIGKLTATDGSKFQKAQLELRAAASTANIQYAVPPVVADLPSVTTGGKTARVRAKIYDYGTVSIKLSFDFSGKWKDFAEMTRCLRQSEDLLSAANRALTDFKPQIASAFDKVHAPLVEDFFIIEVESFQQPVYAVNLLNEYGSALAGLLLGESRRLTSDEQTEALRVRFSYFDNDLVVIQWDSAFIYDTREGIEAASSILEFANTQLAELRTYDARLDAELDTIYKMDWVRDRPKWLVGPHAIEQRAARLRSLLVDIHELADRSSNSLKIIGDAFYARLYRGAASRLSLADWGQQMNSKLNSINEVYRFLTDQAMHARSEVLELIIIFLIAVEIVQGILAHTH